jgi:uncharacterized protein (DUF433 family)
MVDQSKEPVGIEHVPGRCGGRAVIIGHRLTVWLFEAMRRRGITMKEVLEMYDHITAEQVQAAWDYADTHQEEIQRDIDDQFRDD